MKKNILAVAVTAAMIAPATSMAGATFYGHAQAELGSISYEQDKVVDNTNTVTTTDKPTLSLADNARGRIGMKAVEDLGNGWKGLAVFEFRTDTADGKVSTGPFGAREQMVGLRGPMGQIELGRLKAAYKYTGGVKYDAFVTTFLEARGNGGMSKEGKIGGNAVSQFGSSSFHSNAIGYRKGFGPVKLSLTYGPETDDGSYTFSVMFKKGGMEAFVALADAGDFGKSNNKVDYSATKLGGKFKAGAHTVMLQYELLSKDTDNTAPGGDSDPKYLFLAYRMKMGKNLFAVQFGTYDADNEKGAVVGSVTTALPLGKTDVKDLTYLAVGVTHNFSKSTRVFAGYRSTTSDIDSREDVITIGMRKTFKGG